MVTGELKVLSTGGWAPRLPTGLLVSRGTLDPVSSNLLFAYVALTLYGRHSHAVLLSILN